jgi:hypothetical protein
MRGSSRSEPMSRQPTMTFDHNRVMYEDELPEDMTDDEYAAWFALSWVDGVRLGPTFQRDPTLLDFFRQARGKLQAFRFSDRIKDRS